MSQVAFYVDGFNLYHAINDLKRPELKWLSISTLAKSYLERRDTLVGVIYFTAVLKWSAEKYQRHMAYIDALEATGVEVIQSKFLKNNKFCRAFNRYCDFHDEKQTDVAFAVRILSDIQQGLVDRAILVTADSDQIPLVRHVIDEHPTISVEIAAPPGRMRVARELCQASSKFHEISEGRIRTCFLPRNVPDAAGRIAARCPASYLAP